jgi:quercetin dioxygenase-like cupin family protein
MAADAVAVAPDIYKVVLENDRVRVLDARGQPGDKTELHSHPAMVAIAITECHLRFGFPDGQTADAELKPGEAIYLEPVEHTTEIRGTGAVQMVLVELK